MKKISVAVRCLLVVLLLVSVRVAGAAGMPSWWPWGGPPDVLMLSDIHFDPYQDPAKLPQLRAAGVKQWARILSEPASADQPARFAELQSTCHARGVDSSWKLMHDALTTAHTTEPRPMFVLMGGDLLAHGFDCRFRTLVPGASDGDVAAFAAKTVQFVTMQMRRSFPGSMVYITLGNNDSGCADYRETSGDAFLQHTVKSMASGFDSSLEEKQVLKAFSDRGDFAVVLPRKMGHTRLIVLQDIFESRAYQVCGGGKDPDEMDQQIQWLNAQLDAAEKEHQTVWVMTHIPPGVDTFASFHSYVNRPEQLCQAKAPVEMLGSGQLAETLAEHQNVVRLAVFGHTHMDEIRLLRDGAGHVVPGKLIPSVSPVNGNHPSFLVARVNPKTATVTDFTVYVAGSQEGGAWKPEYRYSAVYHQPDFSADSVEKLAQGMAADRTGTDPASQDYLKWFYTGDNGTYAADLKKIWPAYACSITEGGGKKFQECMCPAGGAGVSAGK